jgi:hypothetical protein
LRHGLHRIYTPIIALRVLGCEMFCGQLRSNVVYIRVTILSNCTSIECILLCNGIISAFYVTGNIDDGLLRLLRFHYGHGLINHKYSITNVNLKRMWLKLLQDAEVDSCRNLFMNLYGECWCTLEKWSEIRGQGFRRTTDMGIAYQIETNALATWKKMDAINRKQTSVPNPISTYGIKLLATASISNIEILQRLQSKTVPSILNAHSYLENHRLSWRSPNHHNAQWYKKWNLKN